MELLKVDTLDETLKKLIDEFKKYNKTIEEEIVDINDSQNRILSEDIISTFDVPDFNRTIVDGYAVIASDLQGASDTVPTFLNVVGDSVMGDVCNISINSGECCYVPTGGMIPNNSNACVMIENTENITENKIAIYSSIAEGKNIVFKGDDIKKGEIILNKGTKLSSADIGLMSSIGIKKVKVYKKWKICIISTGDELIEDKNDYQIGKIFDINTNMIFNLCIKNDFLITNKYLIKDDPNMLNSIILSEIKNNDIILTSGGSSKGKKDNTANVIADIASSGILTHGISIRPGKPTITSYDNINNTFIIGLAGHPVASFVLFDLLVVQLYNNLTNCNKKEYSCIGNMTENIPATPGRMTIQLVNIDDNFNVYPIFGKSGIIKNISKADGYVIIENNNEGIKKNEQVKVHYL